MHYLCSPFLSRWTVSVVRTGLGSCPLITRLLSIDRVPLGPRIADVSGSATHTCPGVSPCGVQRAVISTQAASISTTCVP